jgi:hypothetical protein
MTKLTGAVLLALTLTGCAGSSAAHKTGTTTDGSAAVDASICAELAGPLGALDSVNSGRAAQAQHLSGIAQAASGVSPRMQRALDRVVSLLDQVQDFQMHGLLRDPGAPLTDAQKAQDDRDNADNETSSRAAASAYTTISSVC